MTRLILALLLVQKGFVGQMRLLLILCVAISLWGGGVWAEEPTGCTDYQHRSISGDSATPQFIAFRPSSTRNSMITESVFTSDCRRVGEINYEIGPNEKTHTFVFKESKDIGNKLNEEAKRVGEQAEQAEHRKHISSW